jgi:hypothetical protein
VDLTEGLGLIAPASGSAKRVSLKRTCVYEMLKVQSTSFSDDIYRAETKSLFRNMELEVSYGEVNLQTPGADSSLCDARQSGERSLRVRPVTLTRPHCSPQINDSHVAPYSAVSLTRKMAANGSLESESEFWLFGYGYVSSMHCSMTMHF